MDDATRYRPGLHLLVDLHGGPHLADADVVEAALRAGARAAGATVIAGHVAMALSQRPALEGMMYGTVPQDWAAEHHAAWTPAPPPPRGAPGLGRIALALVVAAAGLTGAVWLAADALG